MKIGLDLDGTVYAHPAFFTEMMNAMSGKHQFLCISSHGRNEWEDDKKKLTALGIPADEIDPSLMHPARHGDLGIKGRAADQCDIVFDDDVRLAQFTRTPVFAPIPRK